MFARQITFRLKPNTVNDYTRVFQNDILPLLRKQRGFKDEITLSNTNSVDCVVISLWDRREDAETYNTSVYPQVLNLVQPFIDGPPTVKTFTEATSHSLTAFKAA